MAALDDLLARVADPALRSALEREVAPLRGEQQFGLVFERHLPERVRLHGLAVRRGSLVEITADKSALVWRVKTLAGGKATLIRRADDGTYAEDVRAVEELVVVREFGNPIYPGLRTIGQVERGGDRPPHLVLKAENYHALETLLYTHEGSIDCIYIDPPYNTGAKDWKYNNDYVDNNDAYRHSKWLSFMEKRLLLAKRLLNPAASGLIVTIDEKEVHRLALLLKQVFPGATIQMVSSVINPKGVVRANEFSRTDEYIFFVLQGGARLLPEGGEGGKDVPWQQFRRTDKASARGTSKGGKAQFYPIYVNRLTGVIEELGDAISPEVNRRLVRSRAGCVTVFPVRDDGTEMNWGLTAKSLQCLLDQGFAKTGKYDPGKPQPFPIKYLTSGRLKDIRDGNAVVVGRNDDGSAIVRYRDDASQKKMAQTAWDRPSHNAQYYGTDLLKALMPERSFPFPKSLYAVEDALRFLVGENKDAIVLDFFAGSATTGHAVLRLNHADGGRRRFVLVTNNEVSPDEAKQLAQAGHQPGDAAWEAEGICLHTTIPRIRAAVTGVDTVGNPVEGDYKFAPEFPMAEGFEENVEFLELTYEDPDQVRLGNAFGAIAPLLWLAAGGQGPRITEDDDTWSAPEGARYGVLFDVNQWPDFVRAVRTAEVLTHAFIVTDSESVFQRVVAELPDDVIPVRLYENYLSSFVINARIQA